MAVKTSQEDFPKRKNAVDSRQMKFGVAPIAATGGAKDSWNYAMRSSNNTMRSIGASKFDNAFSTSPTTWDYVLKVHG